MLSERSEPMDLDFNCDMNWSCPTCTFSNDSDETFCQMCGIPTTLPFRYNNFGYDDFSMDEDADLARAMYESMQDVTPSTPPSTTPPLSPTLRRPTSYSFSGFDHNNPRNLARNSFFNLRNNIHSHDSVVSEIWDFAGDEEDFPPVSQPRKPPIKRRYSITKRFEKAHTISFYGSRSPPEELTLGRLSKLKGYDPVDASKFVSKFKQMSQEAKVIMLTGYADVSPTQEGIIAMRMEEFIRDGNVVILDNKSSYICGSPLRELYQKGRKVTKIFSHPEFKGYDGELEFRRMGKGCLIRSEKNFWIREKIWKSVLNFAVDFLALSPVGDFVEILEKRKWPNDLIAVMLEYMFGLNQTEFTDLKEENAFFGTFCPIILLE